jgi:hypothetical protein
MRTPKKVRSLYLEATCGTISDFECEKRFEKATVANKKIVDKLVKKHLPELYEALALNLWNPYKYYKTEKHLILVHSSIDHFLAYE